MNRIARRASVPTTTAETRRIRRALGSGAEGTLVALDRKTGEYVSARDLDDLLDAIEGAALGRSSTGVGTFARRGG